jgi:hypothetical protein
MNIKPEQAITILLEEYRATRREVEQGITDFAKLGPLVNLAIGALLGLSNIPLITKLYLSLPFTCATVLWTLALSRRANLWSEHIGIRQAFLEHRINMLAGYNLLLHENNVADFRRRRGLGGVHEFIRCLLVYIVVQVGLLTWGYYDRLLISLSVEGNNPNRQQFNCLAFLLSGTVVMPLLYWCYIHVLYKRHRRRFSGSCERMELPLGRSGNNQADSAVFGGLEIGNNLYEQQLSEDRLYMANFGERDEAAI